MPGPSAVTSAEEEGGCASSMSWYLDANAAKSPRESTFNLNSVGLGERNRLPQILLLIHVASTRGLGAGHGGVPQKRYPGLPGLGGQREEKPPASAPTCWGPFALQDPIFSGQCFLRLLRSWGCTCGEGGQGQGRAEGIAPEASSPEPERTWEGQGRCHAPPPPPPASW